MKPKSKVEPREIEPERLVVPAILVVGVMVMVFLLV
jgi:hypothetical protein